MDSFSKFTQNVSTSWSPFAEKVGRSLTQYKQLASEKLTNVTTTELPSDYIELESRYEAVRQTHLSLSRLAKAYVTPPAHYDMQTLQHQFNTLTSKINNNKQMEEQVVREVADREATNTYQHGIARASLDVAEKVGLEEPLGAALFKFGSIEEKVGNEKIKQDRVIDSKFIKPLLDTLEGSIAMAQNARKQVAAARLTLDAAKNAFKNATTTRADRVDSARSEVENAEDHFVTVVEEAMKLMRAVVESPENLRHLVAFVNAQLAFHKESAALLGDLAPELEEILVTQEALYRHEQR
ncbi:BAR domain-containing protein [Coemansia sp. RSA 1722]|nr:BAR domain-containing protein [Coemansia sp. RSA 486]KAJ2586227.1 BAR domain-containing protein [Coemansia sp. RSA 1722]